MSHTMASAISLSRAISKRISHRESHNPLSSFTSHKSKRHSDMGIKKGLISGPVELISTTNSQVFTAAPASVVRISTNIQAPPSPESSPAGSPPPLTPDNGYPSSHDLGLPTPPTTPPADKVFSHFTRSHSRSGSAASNSTDASYSSYRHQQLPNRARHSASSSVSTASTSSSTTSMNYSIGPPNVPRRTSSSISRKSSEVPPPAPLSFFPPPPKSQKRLGRSLSSSALRSSSQSQAIAPSIGTLKKQKSSLTGATPSVHPFGKELAQVSELAEEMGLDLDEECMIQKGLYKFSAEDYLAEVEDVVVVKGLFGRKPSVTFGGGGWI